MKYVKETQEQVFNQTCRVHVPREFVKESLLLDDSVRFMGLHKGPWLDGISQQDLSDGVLHIDIKSSLFNCRHTIDTVQDALAERWKGLAIPVPGALATGVYRAFLRVAIALPAKNRDSGRLIARTEFILLVKCMATLLPVSPSSEIAGLYKLRIDEHQGTELLVNSAIEGVSWIDFVRKPEVRYGTLFGIAQEVYLHLALNQGSAESDWGKAWLGIPGASGREVPEGLECMPPYEAYEEARNWAEATAEAVVTAMDYKSEYERAISGGVPT